MSPPSDHLPVCPKCGELGPPLGRVCETCGGYLRHDDWKRDLLVRLGAARRRRYPQVGITPVEENLLDRDPGQEVQESDAGR